MIGNMSEKQYRSTCLNCGKAADKAYQTLPEAQHEGPIHCKACGSNMVPIFEIKFSLEDIRKILEKFKGATLYQVTIDNIINDFQRL
jgi:DNA-directed RNA polymerase subunit RPC12/RpoP